MEGGEWGWAKWVIGIQEGTCDEHWVLYVSDELLNSTLETKLTKLILVNQNLNKNVKIKKCAVYVIHLGMPPPF